MPKIVACLGWKYESKQMIKDFKENMAWVDDFAILDCRSRDELWIHEGEYRRILREMASEKQADYILIASADERYEKNAGNIIRPIVDMNHEELYDFPLRELWEPNKYRIDGIWGNKRRIRLWKYLPDANYAYQPIQCPSFPQNSGRHIQTIDVNIYHLKTIEPENRRLRASVFKQLDPTNKYQPIGYDYLCDNFGLQLEEIPEGREYSPPYKKYVYKIPKKYLDEYRCVACGRVLT